MDDPTVITLPMIRTAGLSPTTVAAGAAYAITVTVEEITKILSPVYPYSGTVEAGQWP